MIIEGLILGGAVKLFKDINTSCNMDADAIRKINKAYRKQGDAGIMVKTATENVDKALAKLVDRKRGIIIGSMKQFIDVYEHLVKIDFTLDKNYTDSSIMLLPREEVQVLQTMTVKVLTPLSDKEIIGAILTGGIGKAMKKDSERALEHAGRHMRAANVLYQEAENMVKALNILLEECQVVSDLLGSLNLLFLKTIRTSKEIISSRGLDKNAYTKEDRETLMVCMNLASALKTIIEAPILNTEGKITKELHESLAVGQRFIEGVNSI